MHLLTVSHPSDPLSDREKAALIKLLSDDDPVVYETVRRRILACGDDAIGWIRPLTLSDDPVSRRRSQEILEYIGRQAADNRFIAFCLKQGENCDIEEAAFLLAQTEYPSINIEGYRAVLDVYFSDLLERIDFGAPSPKILSTIASYFSSVLGFRGNEENLYDPENNYLNRIVDRRTGNPVGLSLVYLLVCRRLNLPVTGIGLPGYFLLRYQSSKAEIFIDAFRRGRLLTKADCIRYLMRSRGIQEASLTAASPRRMLLRICSNLHQIYLQQQRSTDVARFQRYIIALAK